MLLSLLMQSYIICATLHPHHVLKCSALYCYTSIILLYSNEEEMYNTASTCVWIASALSIVLLVFSIVQYKLNHSTRSHTLNREDSAAPLCAAATTESATVVVLGRSSDTGGRMRGASCSESSESSQLVRHSSTEQSLLTHNLSPVI